MNNSPYMQPQFYQSLSPYDVQQQ